MARAQCFARGRALAARFRSMAGLAEVSHPLSEFWPHAQQWLMLHGIRIAVIVALVPVVLRIARTVVDRVVRRLVVPDEEGSPQAEVQREDTLIRIVAGTLSLLVWVMAGMMVLHEIGFDIAPLLATAGVAGIAIGLGGQSLIRDVLAGLFIILENQMRIGDVVRLTGTTGASGVVENITLRMTTLRDQDGTAHFVPNSEIRSVANLSKGFARVNITVGIGYDANLDKVIETVNRVGAELAVDPQFRDSIITPPQFLRVDDFGETALMIRILGDTKPAKQWEIAGELRKRLKIAFDAAEIMLPRVQRFLHASEK